MLQHRVTRRQLLKAAAAGAAASSQFGIAGWSSVASEEPAGAAPDARPSPLSPNVLPSCEPPHSYRAASWWFRWEDFNYPDKGIEEKMRRRAVAFQAAGIDLAIVFGFHFRWDYVYCFDRVHELIRLSRQVCHEHGIKLFDHFSATCVHRPRSMAGEWKLYDEGRNRMTFHPSAEMADSLTWRSSRLNDWRMARILNDEPVFVDGYQCEMFCMNNPAFRKASVEYLEKLRDETCVDGLQYDDGVYYSGWNGCGCRHCRRLFRERHGLDLPDARDGEFWGNYANPHFRQWVRFRYDTAADFLALARDALGDRFSLSACCSGTTNKAGDAAGENIDHFCRAINHVMLEMCGEISTGLISRVPEILVSRAAAVRRNLPCYGLGFAFYPDPAFLVWGLNKFFGIGSWVSAGKGRVNVSAAEMNNLPNEEAIVAEAYGYEKSHPELFQGRPESSLAILFSIDTKINHGGHAADYEKAFHRITQASFEANLPCDVILSMEDAKDFPVLALVDVACLSATDRPKLLDYLRQGGTCVASGPLGIKDEYGNPSQEGFLDNFGLRCRLREPDSPKDLQRFFTGNPWTWANQPMDIPDSVEVQTQLERAGDFFHIPIGNGRLYWTPRRLNRPEAAPAFIAQLRQVLPPACRIQAPPGLRWRVFRNGAETIVHFLNCDFTQAPHSRYHYLKKPIAESLHYHPIAGEIAVHGSFVRGELLSPDLPAARNATGADGVLKFDLTGVRRFCSIRLHSKERP